MVKRPLWVLFVVLVALLSGAGAGASAKDSTSAQDAEGVFREAASSTAAVNISFPIAAPNATVACIGHLATVSDYSKQRLTFKIHETADATATSNCSSTLLPVLQVFATLTHHC